MYIVISDFSAPVSFESISEAIELYVMRLYNQPKWTHRILGLDGKPLAEKYLKGFGNTILQEKIRSVAAFYDFLNPVGVNGRVG